MENLYLVTKEGERHEDHIPIGVFTFAELKKRFPSFEMPNEDGLPLGKWTQVFALDFECYDFTETQIKEVTSSKESWAEFLNQPEPGCYEFSVIRIALNEVMPYT